MSIRAIPGLMEFIRKTAIEAAMQPGLNKKEAAEMKYQREFFNLLANSGPEEFASAMLALEKVLAMMIGVSVALMGTDRVLEQTIQLLRATADDFKLKEGMDEHALERAAAEAQTKG